MVTTRDRDRETKRIGKNQEGTAALILPLPKSIHHVLIGSLQPENDSSKDSTNCSTYYQREAEKETKRDTILSKLLSVKRGECTRPLHNGHASHWIESMYANGTPLKVKYYSEPAYNGHALSFKIIQLSGLDLMEIHMN